MTTTLLFVELLIIGIEVLVWIVLIAVAVFDFSWLKTLTASGWEGILTILFLAASYTAGVLFDRFADGIFSSASDRLKKKIFPDPPEPYVVMRFKIAKEDEFLNHLFEYTRSRMRIARASAINLPLITVSGLILVLVRSVSISLLAKIGLLVLILTFGIAFTILSIYSWNRLMSTHLRLIRRHYRDRDLKGNIEEQKAT